MDCSTQPGGDSSTRVHVPMHLCEYDVRTKKKKIDAAGEIGEGGPEKQLIFTLSFLCGHSTRVFWLNIKATSCGN